MMQVISSDEFLRRFTQSEEGVAFSPEPNGNCLFTSFAMYWAQSPAAQYMVRSEAVKYAQKITRRLLGSHKNTIEPFKAAQKLLQKQHPQVLFQDIRRQTFLKAFSLEKNANFGKIK